jgi:hypothetical protein
LIDCVNRVLPTVDWHAVFALDSRIPVNWDTVPPVLFALGGYQIVSWQAVCEKERRYTQHTAKNCSDAAWRHKGNPAHAAYVHTKKRKEHSILGTLQKHNTSSTSQVQKTRR